MTISAPNDAGGCICARPRSWEARRRSPTGPPRRIGPDPELAADLVRPPRAEAARLFLAARYLQQAAAVTVRGPARDERALSAFELLVRTADVAAASAVRPVIEQLPASARRDTALGQLALLAARPGDAEELLRAAWDAHDPVHERCAGGEAALGLGMLLKMSGAHAEAAVWLDRALGSGTGASRGTTQRVASGRSPSCWAVMSAAPSACSAICPRARRWCPPPGPTRWPSVAWPGYGPATCTAAAGDLALAADRISAGVQIRFPGLALGFLAEAEFRRGPLG